MGQHSSSLLEHTKSYIDRRKFSALSEDTISLLGNEESQAEPKLMKKVRRNQERARKFLRGVWRRRKSKKKSAIDAEQMRQMRENLVVQLEDLIDNEKEEGEEFSGVLFQLMAVGRNAFTLKEVSLFVLYAHRRLGETEERIERERGEKIINVPLGESILDDCNQFYYILSRMEKGSDEDNCYFPANDLFVDYIFGARLSLSVKVHLVRSYLLIRMAILQLRAVVIRGSRKREVDEYKEHVKDCLESYSLNSLDLPSFHPLRSLPLFLLLEGCKEKVIESFLLKRAKELKFTRVSLRGVSQLEGRDAVIRDALEDAWFAYKYPFIKDRKRPDQEEKDKAVLTGK